MTEKIAFLFNHFFPVCMPSLYMRIERKALLNFRFYLYLTFKAKITAAWIKANELAMIMGKSFTKSP
jgi:hypothetical protein